MAGKRTNQGRRRFRQVGLSEDDYRALGGFRRAIRDFLAFSEGEAVEHGLTSQQHQALLAIRAHSGAEPMTVGELAQALLIKSHSAAGLVARLEERDLVLRRASDLDGRRALLELRPRGEDLLESAQPPEYWSGSRDTGRHDLDGATAAQDPPAPCLPQVPGARSAAALIGGPRLQTCSVLDFVPPRGWWVR